MITIKELAEELGFSKVAIGKRIEILGLKSELVKDGNRYLLSDEVADKVRGSYKHKTPGANNQGNQADILQALTNQLAVKDEQIANLQAEVQKLIDNLAEMNKSIQQSQYLLAEKTDTIPHEVQAEVVDQEPTYQEEKGSFTDKIRFWSRSRSK